MIDTRIQVSSITCMYCGHDHLMECGQSVEGKFGPYPCKCPRNSQLDMNDAKISINGKVLQ